MKKKNIFKICFIGAFLFLALNKIIAQVTIGSSIKPELGAMLDLKQDGNSDSNSTKGLLLPRVSLTSIDQLYPMFKDVPDYNDISTGRKIIEDKRHTGLFVFNTNQTPEFNIGLYVWNGQKWDESKAELWYKWGTTDLATENTDSILISISILFFVEILTGSNDLAQNNYALIYVLI